MSEDLKTLGSLMKRSKIVKKTRGRGDICNSWLGLSGAAVSAGTPVVSFFFFYS